MNVRGLIDLWRGRPHHPVGPDGRMALSDHLRELRARIIRSVVVLVVFFIVALFFYHQLLEIIAHPYHQARKQISHDTKSLVTVSGVTAGLTLQLKLCGVAAVVVSRWENELDLERLKKELSAG